VLVTAHVKHARTVSIANGALKMGRRVACVNNMPI
jgi:hypothetical protein